MKSPAILGHIDCPTCGTKAGMRITHDKNGEPFGYCEAECSQQLRIGGDARRVKKFLARHPWAAGAEKQGGSDAAPAAKTVKVEYLDTLEQKTEPAKEPKKRASFMDGLAVLGVK